MPRHLGGKDSTLTSLDLAQGAAVLPGNPHGVLAFLHKACLIEQQHAVWSTHRIGHALMVIPAPLLLIPPHITDEALPPPDGAPLHCRAIGSSDLRSSVLH